MLLVCSSSWHCCALLTPCCLCGRRVRHLLAWPGTQGAVVFVALCLQLVWMIVMLWHWLGKVGCYQPLCGGIKTCHIPVGWTAWLCCPAVAPSILVLHIVSLRHIGLVHFSMVHAVVCQLCVEVVSKLSAHGLAWTDEPGICCSVVPIKCYPNIPFACPITHKFVAFFKCILEMLCMLFANVFHAKIIDNQCELYWSCDLFPKAGYQIALLVSVFVETFLEEFVGQ